MADARGLRSPSNKTDVVAYLLAGKPIVVSPGGRATDVFDPTRKTTTRSILTDGRFAWSKQLAYMLGSSLHAVAAVVASFLGGLALGARWLGVPLARRANAGRTYALLELGVGLLGLALLPLLRASEPLVGSLYRALGGESAGFAAARLALLMAFLLPPAIRRVRRLRPSALRARS